MLCRTSDGGGARCALQAMHGMQRRNPSASPLGYAMRTNDSRYGIEALHR
jgi:hypothetical protein